MIHADDWIVPQEIKNHLSVLTKKWVIDEITDFKNFISTVITDDRRSYSRSFEELSGFWFEYIHEKLEKHNFVNGEPAENTWEKRPHASFWWWMYQCSPQYHRPYYDHHCSSNNRKEQMMNLLGDLINYFTSIQ